MVVRVSSARTRGSSASRPCPRTPLINHQQMRLASAPRLSARRITAHQRTGTVREPGEDCRRTDLSPVTLKPERRLSEHGHEGGKEGRGRGGRGGASERETVALCIRMAVLFLVGPSLASDTTAQISFYGCTSAIDLGGSGCGRSWGTACWPGEAVDIPPCLDGCSGADASSSWQIGVGGIEFFL